MTATCRLSADGRTIIVDLPIAFRRIGGRKQVVLPDGGVFARPTRRRIDGTMIKALARAFRWRKLLENGRHATVAELAAAEKINTSYVSRVLRLTLLAPDIVETIMDGRQPATMKTADLLKPFPVEWPAQRTRFLADVGPDA
ncbi:MAG: hypothetical protein FJ143_13710 [Deltaproteobacteria bacterium]|nr:hypothetical protein [Deltaproteobacteria bacterium]